MDLDNETSISNEISNGFVKRKMFRSVVATNVANNQFVLATFLVGNPKQRCCIENPKQKIAMKVYKQYVVKIV